MCAVQAAPGSGVVVTGDGSGARPYLIETSPSTADYADVVKVTPQTFSTTQQGQARTNIGAAGRDSFNVKDYGALGNGTTDDSLAVLAAINAANGAPVYLPPGRYPIAITLTTQHLNLWGPGVIVQPKGFSAIWVRRPFGAPASVNPPTLVQWGATGTQGSQMLTAFPMTIGIAGYASGESYFISANETYPWNASSGGLGGPEVQVKAGFLTLLGIGMAVSAITNGGPIEGQMVRGNSSGVTGLVLSSITQGGTDVRIVLNKVSGTPTPGEILTVIAGGNVATVPAGTAVGTVGSTWLVKAGKPFDDTYTTSVQLRKVDQAPTCKLDVTIDIEGDMDQYLAANQRRDAVIVEGQFRVDAKLRVRSGWCRAMTLKSCYRGNYDVRVDGLPNHSADDQGGFGYGIALAGATEGMIGTLDVRNVRHGHTTNVNYTALWSSNGQTSGTDRYREWGTAKYNTCFNGFGEDCTNATFDTHPGAQHTTFLNCRAVASSAAGRTASTRSILFTARGIGTSFINCHGDGGGFNDDGSSSNAGFKHVVLVKGCTVKNAPQHGFSQLFSSLSDGAGGFWAEVRIEDCDFGLDRSTAPYPAQAPILLATSNTKIRNVRLSGFNAAPVLINAVNSGGVYEITDLVADYSDGPSLIPFQVAGTVDIFLANYGYRHGATPPSALFESVSGSTNFQLTTPPNTFSKVSTPPILLNTSGTANMTARGDRLSVQSSEANITLTPRVSGTALLYTAPLTVDRNITLPLKASALWPSINSDSFEITRGWASTGAFTIFVKSGTTTIARLAPGDFVKVRYDVSTDAWYLIHHGTVYSGSSQSINQGTDANVSVAVRTGPAMAYNWTTTLAANRNLDFTCPFFQHDTIRVSRPAGGAFSLNVQANGVTLKALTFGQWVDLRQMSGTPGTAPVVVGFGSL